MRNNIVNGLGALLPTVFLDGFAIGFTVPIVPLLLGSLTDQSQTGTSFGYAAATLSYALAGFVCSPMIGKLTIRVGYRRMLLVALAGAAVDFAVAATAESLWQLCVAQVIAGVCGTSMVVVSAYVAKATIPERRAQTFGLIAACFSTGMALGPMVGGWLGGFSVRAALWAAATLCCANFAYVAVVFRDSTAVGIAATAKQSGILKTLAELHKLSGLLSSFTFLAIAHTATQTALLLYTQFQFGWTSVQVGMFLGANAAAAIVGQLLLPRYAMRIYGELPSLLVALIARTIAFILFSLAVSGWQMYAALSLAIVGSMGIPLFMATIAARVPEHRQGETQGALNSLILLATVIGPAGAASISGLAQGALPRPSALLACAAVTAIATLCLVWSMRHASVRMALKTSAV